MSEEQIKKIITQLVDHEARLKELENITHPKVVSTASPSVNNKQKTLREMVRGKKFNNGQEQIAAIVGYYEKVLGKLISKAQIKDEWSNVKMDGNYAGVYLMRAKDTLIRVLDNEMCDLTQTGEEFFDTFVNNESIL